MFGKGSITTRPVRAVTEGQLAGADRIGLKVGEVVDKLSCLELSTATTTPEAPLITSSSRASDRQRLSVPRERFTFLRFTFRSDNRAG
jgi:hypothetical protein